jgi:hypothetical protein
MKPINQLTLILLATSLLLACDKNKEDGAALVPDGRPCGGGYFYYTDGECGCPEPYVLIGDLPEEGNNDYRTQTGICITVSKGKEIVFYATSDCKCTALTNNTPDTFALKFPIIEAPTGEGLFTGRYDRSGYYGHETGYIMRQEGGEEVNLSLYNVFHQGEHPECQSYHPGTVGKMKLFFPEGEEKAMGLVIWQTLGSDATILDTCAISLIRVST